MNNTKIYTAQELRSKAFAIVDQLGGNSVTASMLRYAADVVEENAKLCTLLASTVGYTCTLCGCKSTKMCGSCAIFKAQEMLEGREDGK